MAARATNSGKDEKSASAPKAKRVATKQPKPETGQEQEAAKTQAPTAVQPVEPEDAYLTGTSRSLQRRLLGLNVDGARGQAKPVPDTQAPGLHSTGSYTETTGGPERKPKDTKRK